DRRLQGPAGGQAARHQWIDLRGRRDQHRGPAPSPRVGAGDELDEGRARRARADHLREADLSEEPLPEEGAAQARRLQARRDRQAGCALAEARHLEEAVELTARPETIANDVRPVCDRNHDAVFRRFTDLAELRTIPGPALSEAER